jgi:V/A-type H+/Na+-transporting ATPase subunit D
VSRKFKLSRPELRRQRDTLARYERYLPTLKLKQQQLQISVLETADQHRRIGGAVAARQAQVDAYRAILADNAGFDFKAVVEPSQVVTRQTNVAGVKLPVFEDALFPEPDYSLFSTPAWVDRAVADLRGLNRLRAEQGIIAEQLGTLHRELMRINQRLNLFEKVMIPRCRAAIRAIRIYLGDEQTAAVGRAKIAKTKQAEKRVKDLRAPLPEREESA